MTETVFIAIKPNPAGEGFVIFVNGWGTGLGYRTIEGTRQVAAAMQAESIRPAVVVERLTRERVDR